MAHRSRRPRCSPRFYTSIESEKWSRITNLSSYAIKCTAQYTYTCAEEDILHDSFQTASTYSVLLASRPSLYACTPDAAYLRTVILQDLATNRCLVHALKHTRTPCMTNAGVRNVSISRDFTVTVYNMHLSCCPVSAMLSACCRSQQRGVLLIEGCKTSHCKIVLDATNYMEVQDWMCK